MEVRGKVSTIVRQCFVCGDYIYGSYASCTRERQAIWSIAHGDMIALDSRCHDECLDVLGLPKVSSGYPVGEFQRFGGPSPSTRRGSSPRGGSSPALLAPPEGNVPVSADEVARLLAEGRRLHVRLRLASSSVDRERGCLFFLISVDIGLSHLLLDASC